MKPANPLTGKTVLITGAAQRIGKALTLACAKKGMHVVLHCNRSLQQANRLAEAIRDKGGQAWSIAADLEDPAQAEQLFPEIAEMAGPIHYLINSASIYPEGKLKSFSLDDLEQNLIVNAWSPFVLTRRFAAQRQARAAVNFLDTRILKYDRDHVPYHLSKRALFALTKMSALEFAPRIRINAVAPGLILPPKGKNAAYLRKLTHSNALRRVGSTKDICAAVLFLLESDFVTGQTLYVDGGAHLKESLYGN